MAVVTSWTTTEPTPILVGGAEWPVLFNLWAVRKIEEHYATGGEWWRPGFPGLHKGQSELAAGLVDAIATFFWAGSLHHSPVLTFEQALALLDEATPAELIALPARLHGALADALPEPSKGHGDGQPWDWKLALAVWVTEWSGTEAEFWATTLRAFAWMSDGRAALYDQAKKGRETQAPADGYDLMDLLNMNRRRR